MDGTTSRGSLGEILDGEIEDWGGAVTAVSGCWLAQSQVGQLLCLARCSSLYLARSSLYQIKSNPLALFHDLNSPYSFMFIAQFTNCIFLLWDVNNLWGMQQLMDRPWRKPPYQR